MSFRTTPILVQVKETQFAQTIIATMAGDRLCPRCLRPFRSLSGIQRHLYTCNGRVSRPRIQRRHGESRTRVPIPSLNQSDELSSDFYDGDSGPLRSDELEGTIVDTCCYLINNERAMQYANIFVIAPELPYVVDEPADDVESEALLPDLDGPSNISTERQISEELESSPATEASRYVEYEDDGVRAGAALDEDALRDVDPAEMPRSTQRIDPEKRYWPFVCQGDWELASFFARASMSKGLIEEFFNNPAFAMASRDVPGAMRNYSDLARLTESIPYGILAEHQWLERTITVESQIAGGAPDKHLLRFRPVKEALEFLIGHEPFSPDTAWAPVEKYYGANEARVYDELHTGKWWAKMQSRIPAGGTLIPVILATDKTLMTRLGGDRVAWPVYLQIGNHSRKLRRQQQVPSTILLGLLPVTKSISKDSDAGAAASIKSEVYHTCMKYILERELLRPFTVE